jgi:hypothetical protein
MIIYTEYCAAYSHAVELLEKLQQRSLFGEIIRKLKYQNGLASLLITPVQRLPRYNLLLRDLLKHTPINHPDFEQLKKSIDQIQQLCDRLDVCTSTAMNVQIMTDLAKRKT